MNPLISAAPAAASSAWTSADTNLVLCAVGGIGLVVLLTAVAKLHPFLALIAGTLLVAFSAGVPIAKILPTFETGVGGLLGGVGVIVALGAMLGRLLVDSGGAQQLVNTLVGRSRPRWVPWSMVLAAMIIGIPMFFEVGLVLLVPIVYLVWRRTGGSILRVGIPALAGLSILHGLIPPHPGPLIAIAALHADLGTTLLLGVIVAIPTAILGGPVFGGFISRRIIPDPPARLAEQYAASAPQRPARPAALNNPGPGSTGQTAAAAGATATISEPAAAPPAEASATDMNAEANRATDTAFDTAGGPSIVTTLAIILLPVVIMLARTVVDLTAAVKSEAIKIADFVGDPIIAMAIAVAVALLVFRMGRARANTSLSESLAPIAGILLIIGAGGGFKQMLVETGIANSIGKAANGSHVSLLLLAWLVAVAIRLATGSATVATVTAAGIIAPIAASSPHVSAPLLALAIGSGSLFFSHVNDAGFWLVKEFFGMDVKQTLASWSVMETILSSVSIVVILALGTFVH